MRNRVSDPSRAETLHSGEVRIICYHAALEAKGRSGDDAIRHGEVPMDALEKPRVARQPKVKGNQL